MQEKKITIFQFRDAYLRDNEQNAYAVKLGIEKDSLRFVNGQDQPSTFPDPDSVLGLLLAGSGEDSLLRENFWLSGIHQYLREIISKNIPILGICFGHQILASLLGAEVVSDKQQRELGTISITLTDMGRQDPLFTNVSATFQSIAGHNDSVINLPDTLHVLASNRTCPIQAFRLDSKRVYGVQFHPELDQNDYRARIEYYRDYYTRTGSDFLYALQKGSLPTSDHAILKNFRTLMMSTDPLMRSEHTLTSEDLAESQLA